MIELPVCMATVQTMLGARPDNERKSNNGVTNEIGVRKVRAEIRAAGRSVHLLFRMHVLLRVRGRDEIGLSELRRRIGAATETSDNEAALAVAAYTGTGGVTRSRAGSD